MKRKLVQQAGQAITVTLPIEWVRKNGLKAGDEIEIELIEKDLILTSNKKTVGGTLSLNLIGASEKIKLICLNSAYAKGFDEICLTLGKGEYPSLDQNIGFTIISHKEDNFVIKDVGGISPISYDELFKRIFQRIIGFYDSAMDCILGKKKMSLGDIDKIDHEVNKLSFFLERQIMKSSYPDPPLGKILFAYSYCLEKISDDITRALRISIQEKVNIDKKAKEILELSKKALIASFEMYYGLKNNCEEELFTLREDVREKSRKVLGIDVSTTRLLMYVINVLEACFDLCQLSLMKKMRPS